MGKDKWPEAAAKISVRHFTPSWGFCLRKTGAKARLERSDNLHGKNKILYTFVRSGATVPASSIMSLKINMLQHSSGESEVCATQSKTPLPPVFSPIRPENGRGARKMLPRALLPYWPLLLEFFRYVLVGGGAFLIDISVLELTLRYLFHGVAIDTGILLATATGFIAGLICNYIFSCIFVFQKIDEKAKQHKVRAFILFTIIGVIGLGLTELLMVLGIRLIGTDPYIFIKIFTAGVVLLWNYLARKILIFKGAEWKTDIDTR
jgi:putative flippase GtrA